jgi:hypothetical protein
MATAGKFGKGVKEGVVEGKAARSAMGMEEDAAQQLMACQKHYALYVKLFNLAIWSFE